MSKIDHPFFCTQGSVTPCQFHVLEVKDSNTPTVPTTSRIIITKNVFSHIMETVEDVEHHVMNVVLDSGYADIAIEDLSKSLLRQCNYILQTTRRQLGNTVLINPLDVDKFYEMYNKSTGKDEFGVEYGFVSQNPSYGWTFLSHLEQVRVYAKDTIKRGSVVITMRNENQLEGPAFFSSQIQNGVYAFLDESHILKYTRVIKLG